MTNLRTISTILSLLMITACSPSSTGRQHSSIDANNPGYERNSELPTGTFGSDDAGIFSGDLYVRGYAETQTVDEPFCVEDCKKFEYVMFTVLETGNEHLADFLGVNEGNAYAGAARIGLGCEDDDIIHFANHSDSRQMREATLDAATSKVILNSSDDEPVTLHLSKLPLSGGTDAPACYSHFSDIAIYQ